ncbi:hypothetical protein [Candidatus Hepatobacter penaei]|uniref:hypothetical protein n=1 Tax=Candidatus Hepatobacter penaei TaxID=1274402 RepID=UPI0004F2D3AA|nr:hypothetical protein [Candidatus Hepatobacter penaei]
MDKNDRKQTVEKTLDTFPAEKAAPQAPAPQDVIQDTHSSVSLVPEDEPFWKQFLKGRMK